MRLSDTLVNFDAPFSRAFSQLQNPPILSQRRLPPVPVDVHSAIASPPPPCRSWTKSLYQYPRSSILAHLDSLATTGEPRTNRMCVPSLRSLATLDCHSRGRLRASDPSNPVGRALLALCLLLTPSPTACALRHTPQAAFTIDSILARPSSCLRSNSRGPSRSLGRLTY